MYSALIIAGLAVTGAGWLIRGQFPKPGTALISLGLIGCIGLTVWRLVDSSGGGIPVTNRSHSALAYVIAQRVIQDLEVPEGTATLLFPPEGAVKRGVLDSFYEAFARVLLRFPKLRIEERSARLSAKEARRGDISFEVFEKAFESPGKSAAFISCVGWPPEGERLALVRQNPRPNVYVYDPFGQTNWIAALQAGLINLVVIPRKDAEGRSGEPNVGDPGAIFSRDFLAITAATLEEILSEEQLPR